MVNCENILKNAGIEDHNFEARELIRFVTGLSPEYALLHGLSQMEEERLIELANKRATGYPLQYIIGEWEFMGLPFKVKENVLIPRADTETLVEEALKVFKKGDSILDLCCGSGCIGISIAKIAGCKVTALDLSQDAVDLTKENAALNGADITVLQGDLFKMPISGEFDGIVCNPPYLTKEDMENLQREVKHEPALALYGGDDGLDFYRFIINEYTKYLKKGGALIFETGCNQTEDTARLMEKYYADIRIIKDIGGNPRVVTGIKRGM